jgi:hypothetical protein
MQALERGERNEIGNLLRRNGGGGDRITGGRRILAKLGDGEWGGRGRHLEGDSTKFGGGGVIARLGWGGGRVLNLMLQPPPSIQNIGCNYRTVSACLERGEWRMEPE